MRRTYSKEQIETALAQKPTLDTTVSPADAEVLTWDASISKYKPSPGLTQTQGDTRYRKIADLIDHANALLGANLVGWKPPGTGSTGSTLAAQLLGRYADPKNYGAYGGEKVTTGTVTAGDLSHITLTSVTGLKGKDSTDSTSSGNDLMIETLGASAGKHYSEIQSISGNIVTLVTPVVSAGTGVTVTVYDREAVMRAHDYLQSVGGGVLRLDATHVIARTPPIIQSNVTVIGTPRGSLKHHSNTPLGSLLDVVNGGGGGQVGTNISFENVTFDGNRAGQSSWTAATTGVPGEYTMCVRLYDAEDVIFRSCKFKNPVGDGITMTAPASGPVGCNRITVDDCRFIGTNDNRNGISVVYAQNFSIINCYFYRMSKTTMVGPIDLEPDAGFSVKDGIVAGNKIMNPSGTLTPAGITLSSGASGRIIENVKVVNNIIRGLSTTINIGIRIKGLLADTRSIEVAGNEIYGTLPIGIQSESSSSPFIHHNSIYGPTRGIAVIDTSFPRVESNHIVGCPAFGIRQDAAGCGGEYVNNRIIDCGSSGISTSAGISVISTVAGGTRILGNHVSATDTTNYMRYGIHLAAACNYGNEIAGNYINNAGTTNLYVQTTNAQILGLNNLSASTSNTINGTYPPASGTWAQGTRIHAQTPAAGAAPGWVCTTAGTPGTWTPISIVASQATETVIGPAEIATQAETNAASDDARIVTPLKLGAIRKLGLFSAYKGTDQLNFTSGAFTKVTFTTEEFDISGWYDATNSRFTPLQAGYYRIGGSVVSTGITDGKIAVLNLYKNGADAKSLAQSYSATASGSMISGGDTIVFANGSTDYFELFFYHDVGTATPDVLSSASFTWFQAQYIGPS